MQHNGIDPATYERDVDREACLAELGVSGKRFVVGVIARLHRQKAHDVFLFEQEGSFVVRLFTISGTRSAGHQLSEFTRDEILAMIESAPEQRQ